MKRADERTNNNLEGSEYEKMLDEKLEDESKQIPVPDSLLPENVKKRLVQKKKKSKRYLVEIAAAIVLVVALGGTGVYKMITKDAKEELQMNTKQETQMVEMDEVQADADRSESQIGNVTHEKKIGDYRQAKNYEEVY